jgi:hypothetical protein
VRVECEACRALVVASFGIEGGAVRATCSACRHVMILPEAGGEASVEAPVVAPAAEPRAPAVDVPACPKCGAALRGAATACPCCGLAVARMAAYTEARAAAVSEGEADAVLAAVPEALPEAVLAAWTRVTEDWNDAGRHDELLQRVAASHAYAWAAGRYRTHGGDPMARRQLDRLRRAAEATLLSRATARPVAAERPYRGTRRILALLVTTIAAGTLYAMVLRDHPLPSRERPIPARLPTPGHPVGWAAGK